MVLHSPRKRAPERAWGFESLALRLRPPGHWPGGLFSVVSLDVLPTAPASSSLVEPSRRFLVKRGDAVRHPSVSGVAWLLVLLGLTSCGGSDGGTALEAPRATSITISPSTVSLSFIVVYSTFAKCFVKNDLQDL